MNCFSLFFHAAEAISMANMVGISRIGGLINDTLKCRNTSTILAGHLAGAREEVTHWDQDTFVQD